MSDKHYFRLKVLLSFNKKLYNQVWHDYESAIDCQAFKIQELCASKIEGLKIRISWIEKEIMKISKREITWQSKKVEIIELDSMEKKTGVACRLYDVNKKKTSLFMVG